MGNKETAPKTAAQRQAEMRERRNNDTLRRELIETEAFIFHGEMFGQRSHGNEAAQACIGESPLATLRRFNEALQSGLIVLVVPDPFETEQEEALRGKPRDVTHKRSRKQGAAKSPVAEK
jgi:hypothetical protein